MSLFKKSIKIGAPSSHLTAKRDLVTKNWTQLASAITAIYDQKSSELSYEQLYRCGYDLLLYKYGATLYTNVENAMVLKLDQLKFDLRTLINASESSYRGMNLSVQESCKKIIQKWEEYVLSTKLLASVLEYMDNVYVEKENPHLLKVFDNGLRLFRTHLLLDLGLGDWLVSCFINYIKRERNGEKIDRSCMKQISRMFLDLSCYDMIEQEVLKISREYYQSLSQELLQTSPIPEYLRIVWGKLEEEKSRVDFYLPPNSKGRLEAVVVEEILTKHLNQIIDSESSGFTVMIENDELENLELMYKVFSYSDEFLSMLAKRFQALVSNLGHQYVLDEVKLANPVQFVHDLVERKEKYDQIIARSFLLHSYFVRALEDAFKSFCDGSVQERCPEYLSLYLNSIISKRNGRLDESIESLLERIIELVKYLRDIDIFEEYYKLHLSKRLLSTTDSLDEEKLFLTKLKREKGYNFTSKIERMFNDVESSPDLHRKYKEHAAFSMKVKEIDLYVNVLTHGIWPSSAKSTSRMPQELETCCNSFVNFYNDCYSGRTLTWQLNLGDGVLIANLSSTHELLVSTNQMILLLAFNNQESMTFAQIKSLTEIPEKHLKQCLLLLCFGKHKILKKQVKSKEIQEDEVFSLNTSFTSPSIRIRLIPASVKESEPEIIQTKQRIDNDRKPVIEAAIVRIMKARKQLHHRHLVEETIKQLSSRFVPEPVEIKKRIENLIERDFIERSETDSTMYTYIA